jgi:hypothetical protein
MDKLSNLALIAQMIESAEKNIQSAKHLLREMMGGAGMSTSAGYAANGYTTNFAERAQVLNVSDGGKVVEGVFDGQNMVGPDGKQYPVPANYASKSKLIEGDVLKLTIADDGSFIYKQIGPVDRIKVIGILTKDERGDFRVVADGRTYRVLLASVTYFKAELGDEVTLVVPKDGNSTWAAVENVIKPGTGGGSGDGVLRTAHEEEEMNEV